MDQFTNTDNNNNNNNDNEFSNTDDESVFENIREQTIWSNSIDYYNPSELSTLEITNDIVDLDHSLEYSESDVESESGSSVKNDPLNTANMDIQLDQEMGSGLDKNAEKTHIENYYFNRISDLTDKYITMNSNLNSTNSRLELIEVSNSYTEHHVNYLYESLHDSKCTIELLHQSLNKKNKEFDILRNEYIAMNRRIETMELRWENMVKSLKN